MQDTHFPVTTLDMRACGFGPEFAGDIPGFSGTDNSPYLVPTDPAYVFDNTEAMRTMYLVWTRELTRDANRHRKGLFISGPTGSGKTSFIEQFFSRLQVPVIRTTWNPKREAEELVHSQTLVDGDILPRNQAIATAAELGIPVLINEIDLAEPGELMALADIIEKGFITRPDAVSFTAKRGFMVFATGNTAGGGDESGMYADTRTQNGAVLRRFFHLHMGYPKIDQELEFLRDAFPNAPDTLLQSSSKVIDMIRRAYDGTANRDRLSAPISRPEALDWIDMMLRSAGLANKGVNVAQFALNMAFSARLNASDQVVVENIVSTCFNS